MTIQEAINFVDIARMNYICDPHECGLEKGKDPCTAFHCDEMHDALVMAIEALEKQIPKKPTHTGEKNVYGGVVRICKECGDKVCISPMAREYENYCRRCGKRLTDWSDTE